MVMVNVFVKKRMGRPKIGKKKAKGKVIAARFTPIEAQQIDEAIRRSSQNRPGWIRKALLAASAPPGH